MNILAPTVFLLLAAISALHVAWGFGLRWPAASERELVATVIGANQRTRMPGLAACLVAAAAIFGAGCTALLMSSLVAPLLPKRVLTAAGFLWLAIFTLRGAAAYLPAWRNVFSQAPFARYDPLYYAPLCLFVAFTFAMLLVERLSA